MHLMYYLNEKGERERARRVHAGWRDSYGVWRNADNSPCEVAGEASGVAEAAGWEWLRFRPPSDATDAAVHANIAAAGYGK